MKWKHWHGNVGGCIAAAILFSCLDLIAGEVIYGPDARLEFEFYRDAIGDKFIDFEQPQVSSGSLTQLTIDDVVLEFKTTQKRYPSVQDVDFPVVVLPYGYVSSTRNGTQTLMGSGSAFISPDGQARYEIRFSKPQARVGMMRLWNVNALTRFYNPSGVLLGEHQNVEANEFVAWIAGSPNESEWVARVEIDGNNAGGGYQVGETDDLFFGTAKPPEPGELVWGDELLDRFIEFGELLGDALVDFNDLNYGPLTELTVNDGSDVLTFRTIEKRYPPPSIAVDYAVSIPNMTTPSGTREIMGASSNAGYADGQNRYEVRFSRPQHRVGVMRRWNTHSITRFYGPGDVLLGEHKNTTSHEFIGWIGNPGDESTWVTRVEMDGDIYQDVYQVGWSDDLRFGRTLPDRRDMRIESVTLSPDNSLTVLWGPEQVNHVFEYSHDMVDWSVADGELTGVSWSGPIPGEIPVYFRVLTHKLFE